MTAFYGLNFQHQGFVELKYYCEMNQPARDEEERTMKVFYI